MKKLIKKTNGKKTESVGLLNIAFQVLAIFEPGWLTPEIYKATTIVLSSGVVPTLAHRIWRNRTEIGKYIKKKFKGLKRS
jgi:hypothetical protein